MKIGEENEHKEEAISKTRNSGVEENVKDPTPNPLEKYMRIIQQSREQELANKVTILKTGSQKILIEFLSC